MINNKYQYILYIKYYLLYFINNFNIVFTLNCKLKYYLTVYYII